jgi:hypothetical protein
VARNSPSPQIQSNPQKEVSKRDPPSGLYSLYIIRESGCPFFYRIYNKDDNHPDPAILGGFFVALSLFAKEVTDGHIETVTTEPCRFTFHQLNRGLLVICSAKNFNPIALEKIARRISQLFVTKYSDRLLNPQSAEVVAPNLSKHIDRIFGETITSISNQEAEVIS